MSREADPVVLNHQLVAENERLRSANNYLSSELRQLRGMSPQEASRLSIKWIREYCAARDRQRAVSGAQQQRQEAPPER